jgi:hypothetical protein
VNLANPDFLLKIPRIRVAIRETGRNVNKPFAKAGTRRALAASPRPVRVEIGSLTPAPAGWSPT